MRALNNTTTIEGQPACYQHTIYQFEDMLSQC